MIELALENITKSYGENKALDNISLKFTQGIYGLLGPNGAGKSTMMNLITGNITPTEGEILWCGERASLLKKTYRTILGYAPQQQGLYDSFTGKRFLSYMATLKDIPPKEMESEIERVLSYVNLLDAAKLPIGTYSGGMKQRLLIAQAILGTPKLIVLDEPTAGLDPKERVRIREKIHSLAGEKIIIVSTHVVSDIQSIAKEIILLKDGVVVDRGSVEELCAKYQSPDNLEQVYLQVFGED